MSLIDADSKFPIRTLRKHTSSITSLEFVKIPVSTKIKTITLQNVSNSMVLKPFLLSSDESGKVILWELTTLRPVIEIQAHESQILTIRQMGIQDGVVDSNYFGLVLTHGRDNCVKFWRIFNENGSIVFEKVYELPVNALNFSNVDILGDLLITPNTRNSNTFDLYDMSFISKGDRLDDTRLKRLFESVDVYKHASSTGFSDFEEFGFQREEQIGDEVNRADKFGIIMKLLFIDKHTAFIGYESGHVASLNLYYERKTFEIRTINNQHFPNPVLSLTYDKLNNVVLSTSIDSKIVVHDLQTLGENAIELEKFGKISGVVCLDDNITLSSWNGYIRFYKLHKEQNKLVYVSSFKKPKGLLAGDLNVIGNITEDINIEKSKNKIVKPNCLAIMPKSIIDHTFKQLLNRRDLRVIEKSYLSVGYDDGTITLYDDL